MDWFGAAVAVGLAESAQGRRLRAAPRRVPVAVVEALAWLLTGGLQADPRSRRRLAVLPTVWFRGRRRRRGRAGVVATARWLPVLSGVVVDGAWSKRCRGAAAASRERRGRTGAAGLVTAGGQARCGRLWPTSAEVVLWRVVATERGRLAADRKEMARECGGWAS